MTPHDHSMQIIKECAREHGVTVAAVLSRERFKNVTTARWNAYQRLRDKGLSYNQIGMKMGRNHTTVLYALRRLTRGINAWDGCRGNGKRGTNGRYKKHA